MTTYTLVLPLPPRALHPNSRPCWQAKAAAKSKYRETCAMIAALDLRFGSELEHVREATIQLRYFVKRRNDPDNLIAWAKVAIDSLKVARVLADDDRVSYPPVEQFVDRDNPRLELVITPERTT